MKEALLCVDLQNDFYEDGALPVEGASEINFQVNKLLSSGDFTAVAASQDWHPPEHKSFASSHGVKPFTPYEADSEGLGPVLWPDHCVQNSEGAEFHPEISTEYFDLIIRKGQLPEIDSYSAFRDNDGRELGLAGYFKDLEIEKILVVGLALDVCVFFTVQDALKYSFEVELIQSATKGVEAQPGDIAAALEKMEDMGAVIRE